MKLFGNNGRKSGLFLLLGIFCLCLFLAGQGWCQGMKPQPDVVVNGIAIARDDIFGDTGSDLAIQASPLFRALGAKVSKHGNQLEATWNHDQLVLMVGRPYCVYNGQKISLQVPPGLYDDDLVVQLQEMCNIVKARVEKNDQRVAVWSNEPPLNQGQVVVNNVVGAGGASFNTASAPGDMSSPVSAKSLYLTQFQNNGGNVLSNSSVALPTFGQTATSTYNSSAQSYPSSTSSYPGMSTSGTPAGGYATTAVSAGSFNPSVTGAGDFNPIVSEPDALNSTAFPEPGMGGLSSKDAKSSPYERPVVSVTDLGSRQVTTATPRTINDLVPVMGVDALNYPYSQSGVNSGKNENAAVIRYSPASPAAAEDAAALAYSSSSVKNGKSKEPKPAKPELVSFEVVRQMSFHLTSYEMKAKIRNTGDLPCDKPFMVKLMVASNFRPQANWDLVENYLITPLAPGQEVEITKRADGHQFPCLIDTMVKFKAVVLEEVVKPANNPSGRNWQNSKDKYTKKYYRDRYRSTATNSVKETSSMEKEMHY